MNQSSRIEILQKLIEANPRDGLALYALALEYKSQDQLTNALELFDRLLQIDPDHVAAYFQKALVLVALEKTAEAKRTLEAGIPKAVESGHLHARDKMREILEKIK